MSFAQERALLPPGIAMDGEGSFNREAHQIRRRLRLGRNRRLTCVLKVVNDPINDSVVGNEGDFMSAPRLTEPGSPRSGSTVRLLKFCRRADLSARSRAAPAQRH